ncbi:MAG: hypothetical protein KGM99_04735 [Burkholderiales bacterium]|nr:hypothetical protein [Burkholderiales bacterium]
MNEAVQTQSPKAFHYATVKNTFEVAKQAREVEFPSSYYDEAVGIRTNTLDEWLFEYRLKDGASPPVSVNVALPNENAWESGINCDIFVSDLPKVWFGGAFVAAQPKKIGCSIKKPSLGNADLIFVAVNLAVLPTEKILANSFTQKYLAAGAFSRENIGVGLLAFRLPSKNTNGRLVSLMMKGLQTLYAGSQDFSNVLQGFGSLSCDAFVTTKQVLPEIVVKRLLVLGEETLKFKARGYLGVENFPRSKIFLDVYDEVQVKNLDLLELKDIATGTEVFCPVHADIKATAKILRDKNGLPVVCCTCCRRNFGVVSARSYDFTYFDRVFKDLAEDEAKARLQDGLSVRQFVELHEKFLPSLLPMRLGLNFIKSGKGTGKTAALKNLVAQCKTDKQKILVVGHRRTLLQSLSDKLGLVNYMPTQAETVNEEADDELEGSSTADVAGDDGIANEPSDFYAISLDSLGNLEPDKHKYDVIVIDESEQVFSHLISPTLKDKRKKVYLTLRHYLKQAKYVYLLDADLNMVTMDTLLHMNISGDKPFSMLVNYPPATREEKTYQYACDKQLTIALLSAVKSGDKCYVATNSINEVKRLALAIKDAKPDCRMMCVHGQNSHAKEVQNFISNIGFEMEHNYDVLIASPALGTGVDISYRDQDGNPRTVINKVFGKFKRGITTHFDIDQAVMRVREPGEVHVWVDAWKFFYECDPVVLRQMLERCVGDTHKLLDFDDDGTKVLAPEDGLIDIWARIKAVTNGSKNQLAPLYEGLRIANGYRLTPVDMDEGASVIGKAVMGGVAEKVKDARVLSLLIANTLDFKEAKALSSKDQFGESLNDAERAQLERYRIETFYCKRIDRDVIEFDAEGAMRSKVVNLEYLLWPTHWVQQVDKNELDDVMPFDLRLAVQRRDTLGCVLTAAGLFDAKNARFNTEYKVEKSQLRDFVGQMVLHKAKFQTLFNLQLRNDLQEKPTQQLTAVLGLIGLRFKAPEQREVNGYKIRSYQLDEGLLSELQALIQRRNNTRFANTDGPTLKKIIVSYDVSASTPSKNETREALKRLKLRREATELSATESGIPKDTLRHVDDADNSDNVFNNTHHDELSGVVGEDEVDASRKKLAELLAKCRLQVQQQAEVART